MNRLKRSSRESMYIGDESNCKISSWGLEMFCGESQHAMSRE